MNKQPKKLYIKEIIETFKNEISIAPINPLKVNNITAYTPYILIGRLKNAGVYSKDTNYLQLEMEIAEKYDKKLHAIKNDEQEVSLARERMQKLLNEMDKNNLNLKMVNYIVMQEMADIQSECEKIAAEKHRKIMLDFVDEYYGYIKEKILLPKSQRKKDVQKSYELDMEK